MLHLTLSCPVLLRCEVLWDCGSVRYRLGWDNSDLTTRPLLMIYSAQSLPSNQQYRTTTTTTTTNTSTMSPGHLTGVIINLVESVAETSL